MSFVYWVTGMGNLSGFMLVEGHKAMGRPGRAEHQQRESKTTLLEGDIKVLQKTSKFLVCQ